MYGSLSQAQGLVSHDQIPDIGILPQDAANIVQDDLLLDGNPHLNLAGYHTTSMDVEIEAVMQKNLAKNITHHEAYPAALEMENRCIKMVSSLLHGSVDRYGNAETVGLSSLGSSEGVILSILAAKRRWQNARKVTKQPINTPNMILSSTVHICWKKAALFLDIDIRYVDCDKDRFVIDPKQAIDLVDENTILVGASLGVLYTGQYDDVKTLNDLLEAKNARDGLQVRIHVDAASGGFVAPFLQPELLWDFRLPMVASINISGHKYGFVYAAVGWNIWRSKAYLPEEFLFTVGYCGSQQISFTLNFSKPAAFVIGQYYQFLRLGKNGYRETMHLLANSADRLSHAISGMCEGSRFTIVSNCDGQGLPIVAWRLTDNINCRYDEFDIARQIKTKGWIVPAYTISTRSGDIKLLRIVVRTDFSPNNQLKFIEHLREVIETLNESTHITNGNL